MTVLKKTGLVLFMAVFMLCPSVYAGTNEVSVHSKTDIAAYLEENGVSERDPVSFAETPEISSVRGELSDNTKYSALKMMNNIRYIAGLESVTLDKRYGDLAQAAAFTNWSIGELTHYPGNYQKPEGISDSDWQDGITGAGSSNIAWGYSTLNQAIMGWMSDEDSYNISKIGHRRWILNPGMGSTGFGASSASGAYYDKYYAMYSFDFGGSGSQKNVAWPARNMPVGYFGTDIPWSISTGSVETKNSITVSLERLAGSPSGAKTWTFKGSSSYTASNAGTYFNVDNGGYGLKGCIIFRPAGVGAYKSGDVFRVTITGTKEGTISYIVEFFDVNDPDSLKDNQIDFGATGKTGTVFTYKKNRYKITRAWTAANAGRATLITAGSMKNVSVPNSIIYNGQKYSVDRIGPKAFKGKKIRKVTIGANVKKIDRNAFYKSRAKTVVIKTKGLKKSAVKGSLKKSKVKTIKVKVGSKKQNRYYVKKYKKIFNKKNVGKKVKVL